MEALVLTLSRRLYGQRKTIQNALKRGSKNAAICTEFLAAVRRSIEGLREDH
jgi:hypothetical protein